MPIYEYLVVLLTTARNVGSVNVGHVGPDGNQTWAMTYEFWWPNAWEADKRLTDRPVSVTLNDLGQDGWKLVDSALLDTAIFNEVHGLPEVSIPVRQRWTFMREARS
jgi:hypothetical protein